MSVYQPVFQKVIICTFWMMENQRLNCRFIEGKETPCQGRWSTIYGLPCSYQIRSRIASKTPLGIGDINCHWYIDRPISTTPISNGILDPLPLQATRGSDDRPISHTGRILSGHEPIEKSARYCGVCTPPDHVKIGCNRCE
jgi:hypothetical protein